MEKYDNPAATASVIVLNDKFEILLIKRKNDPYKNYWALPGGFLECGKETLEDAAIRELKEETSLIVKKYYLTLFKVSSEPKRDPRGHVIDHVFLCDTIPFGNLKASDDAASVKYFSLCKLPKLAFDHSEVIFRLTCRLARVFNIQANF